MDGNVPPANDRYGTTPDEAPTGPARYSQDRYGRPPHRRPGLWAVAGCGVAILSALVSAVIGGVAGLTAWQIADRFDAGRLSSRIVSAGIEPVAAAAREALPSVVNIDVMAETGSSGLPNGHPDVPSGGTGSGVAYKRAPGGDTYLITNNHVIQGAKTITVTPADGERITATLVGRDAETDIAVIRIGRRLPVIGTSDSDDLVEGQTVVAIGSPFGLQHSVSSGVVSAVHRAITSGFSRESTGSATPLVDVIQTDAAINPGNSGGALVDRRGMLIGINTALFSESGGSSGIGFAIPSNTVLRVAEELVATGDAKHPFLGVEGRTVTPSQARELELPSAEGAYIENVLTGTGAAQAGLRRGDVVLEIDGEPVRSMDDLILNVRRTRVGDTVELEIWRGKARRTLSMTVGDKPTTVP